MTQTKQISTKTELEVDAYRAGRAAGKAHCSSMANPYADAGKGAALGLNGQQTADAYRAWNAGWKAA